MLLTKLKKNGTVSVKVLREWELNTIRSPRLKLTNWSKSSSGTVLRRSNVVIKGRAQDLPLCLGKRNSRRQWSQRLRHLQNHSSGRAMRQRPQQSIPRNQTVTSLWIWPRTIWCKSQKKLMKSSFLRSTIVKRKCSLSNTMPLGFALKSRSSSNM